MLITLLISFIVIAAFIASILFLPSVVIRKHTVKVYSLIPMIGALILVMSERVDFGYVVRAFSENTSVNPLKILVLFLSMTTFSLILEQTGFFAYISTKVLERAGHNQYVVFLSLYAVISILTVFTSNDIIILTFTPFICHFCRSAKIRTMPYLIMEFVAANTWSMALIVGNPTNIYLAQSAGISFAEYFSVMFFPAIVGGLTGLLMIFLIFRKDLLTPVTDIHKRALIPTPDHHVKLQKTPMLVAMLHLACCIILLAISDYIGVEMWLICLMLALSLTTFDLIYDISVVKSARPVWRSIKKEPYELVPFVLSMFVIVLALKECGAIQALNGLLINGNKLDGLLFGLYSAGSANLLNNIPMSVMFEGIINSTSSSAVYGAVIGSNVGAFITPVGALAGIMWSKILEEYGIKLPFLKFVKYGVIIAIPTLLTSCGALLLVL